MEMLRHNIDIYRGTTFEMEVVTQRKIYKYDPDKHNSTGDKVRTHIENLEYYGHTMEYVNFKSGYSKGQLIIRKPWVRSGQSNEPLLTLTLEDGYLEFTTRSVKINLPSTLTETLDFDDAKYELLVIAPEVLSTEDTKAGVTPKDTILGLLYGSIKTHGIKK